MKSRNFICFFLLGVILFSNFVFYLDIYPLHFKLCNNPYSNEDNMIRNSSPDDIYYLLDWYRFIDELEYGGVAVDSENNVYYGGSINANYAIAKFHENGTHLWTIQTNIFGTDLAEGVAVDLEDNVYITGFCYPGTQTTGTIVTLKYNKTGDFQWERSLGTEGRAYDITTDNENNIYVTGYTEEFGASYTDRDIIVIKYDSEGNQKWYRRSHVIGHDEGNAVIYNPISSSIYITGKAHGNMILLMYNKNGDLVLSTEWDNGGTEYGNDITVNPNTGDLYIVGGLGHLCVVYDSMCNNILNLTGPSQKSITLDSSGNLFVSNYYIHDVILGMYSSIGTKFWELRETNYYPFSLDMDCDNVDNIYLICTEGSLYKFAIDHIKPIINITEPKPDEEFGRIRPDVILEIDEPNLDLIRYSLSNQTFLTKNYTWVGNIHQKVWEIMGNGNITIKIYANDTNGNMGYNYVSVIKNTSLTYYWDLNGTQIYIDDMDPANNWLEIDKKYPWCYGSGTPDDPYIIENVFVNGSGTGKCLQIKNSLKNFIIKNCTLVESGLDYRDAGIYLDNITNGRIVNCTSINNYNGIRVLGYSKNNSYFSNNLVDNRYGIIMIRSDLTLISNNRIENNVYGIELERCTNQKIFSNIFINDPSNLWLDECSDLTIYNNTFGYGSSGIRVEYGERIYIKENIIKNCDWCGLHFDTTQNSHIENNTISQNANGIIMITDQANGNNTINNNIITKNGKGIGINDINCVNNCIYNNSFYSNTAHASDGGTNNLWDNGVLGNYWDNYNGKDINDDGIGDDPYHVGNGVDNYPIWWDSPVFYIENPTDYMLFGKNAPQVSVVIEEGIIDNIFYTIDLEAEIHILPQNMTINQSLWSQLENGTVLLQFYVNDSRGYISDVDTIILRKDILSPIIEILSPHPNQEFNSIAPNYEIYIDEANLDRIWYIIGNISTKFYISNLSGTLDEFTWDLLFNGKIMLRFYANDTLGNEAYHEIYIQKNVPIQLPMIPGFNILSLIANLLLIILIIKKKSKITKN